MRKNVLSITVLGIAQKVGQQFFYVNFFGTCYCSNLLRPMAIPLYIENETFILGITLFKYRSYSNLEFRYLLPSSIYITHEIKRKITTMIVKVVRRENFWTRIAAKLQSYELKEVAGRNRGRTIFIKTSFSILFRDQNFRSNFRKIKCDSIEENFIGFLLRNSYPRF